MTAAVPPSHHEAGSAWHCADTAEIYPSGKHALQWVLRVIVDRQVAKSKPPQKSRAAVPPSGTFGVQSLRQSGSPRWTHPCRNPPPCACPVGSTVCTITGGARQPVSAAGTRSTLPLESCAAKRRWHGRPTQAGGRPKQRASIRMSIASRQDLVFEVLRLAGPVYMCNTEVSPTKHSTSPQPPPLWAVTQDWKQMSW